MKQLKTVLQSIACIALLAGFNQANAATQLYFIHNDHLGTPQVVTDENQTVVWEGRQKPFGEVEVTTNTIDNDARFPGQYLDEESGLHYNYFRDYDPTIGRYIQSDPIGLEGGINTYAYTLNNPIRYTDPTGEAVPAVIAACAANPACAAAVTTGLREVVRRTAQAVVNLGGAVITSKMQSPSEDARREAESGRGQCTGEEEGEDERCEEMLRVDTSTCNAITRFRGRSAGAACHASATERYGACLAGRPIPPLNTWNN